MRSTKAIGAVAIGAVGLLLLTACGNAQQDPFSPAAGALPPAEDQADAPEPASGTTTLSTSTDDVLGEIVVDEEGYTLYRFDDDSADPPQSNCNGGCAEAWPPVLAGEDVVFDDPGAVGTIVRDDGTQQVTIGNWPVYRYAQDTAPGDAEGEAVGDVWWAVSPTGAKAADEADEQQAAAQDSGVERVWPEGGVTEIRIINDGDLGEILVDGDGFTIYRFDDDSANPPTTTCEGACLDAWPRVMVGTANIEFEGDDSVLGLLEFEDGTCQLTVDGWPAYYYAEDTAPGQTNGEAVGDVWWAVAPDGGRASQR